jgi:hypothetical protein
MWRIYTSPKTCGHPLDQVDYTCIMCVYVELCKTQDKLHEAQDLIRDIADGQRYDKRIQRDVYTYPDWALQ